MTERWTFSIIALFVLAGSAACVGAQPAPLAEALEGIDAGAGVRVLMFDGRRLEGEYAGTAGDRLALRGEGGPEFVPLADITALWERGRATGKGGRIGAWTAGLAFAVYGGLMEMVLQYDDSFPAAGIMLGGLFGATTGGAAGALVGSAIPDWHLRWGEDVHWREVSADTQPGVGAPTGGDKLLGQVSFGLGAIDPAGGESDQGLMVTGMLTSSLGKRFRHGLELASTGKVKARPSEFASSGSFYSPPAATRVWSAGWRLEWSFTQPHEGRWDPYFVVGAGAYGWVETYFGANYGLGVRWMPRGGATGAYLEVRRHDNLQNLSETDPGFASGVLGISRVW